MHEDTHYTKGALNFRIQKCFAIRPGINGMLDVARRTYTEIVDDISNLIQNYSEQYQLPLRSAFTVSKDFHIQLNLAPGSQDLPQLPPIFIKVTKSKNRLLCTTQEILQLNNRVNQSLDEIYLMSNVVLSSLMENIRANIGMRHDWTFDKFGPFLQNLCNHAEYLHISASQCTFIIHTHTSPITCK